MNLLINNKLCPQCFSSDIIHDEIHALFYCGNCGLVCKDETIMNDDIDVVLYENAKRELRMLFEDKFFELFGESIHELND